MVVIRTMLLAGLLSSGSLLALSTAAFPQTCSCASSGIHAEQAPPELPTYDQPPIPAAGYIWTPGYWAWNNEDYYFVPGTWVEPPHPGLLWTPGYWGYSNGVYVFNAGYWGEHVGFYGGIAYGYGYDGSGYHGGRWQNGQFFYNTTVNNVVNVHITNVYKETINVNNSSRVSFNGGKGGIEVKPTAEQEAAAKEQHEKPTAKQLANSRAASTNANSFVSTNHGKPEVAATPRAGELTGEGVVKAKTAETPNGATEPSKPNAATGNEPPKPGAETNPKPGTEPESKQPTTEEDKNTKPPKATEQQKPNSEGTKPSTEENTNKPKRVEKPRVENEPKPEPATGKTPEEEKPATHQPKTHEPEKPANLKEQNKNPSTGNEPPKKETLEPKRQPEEIRPVEKPQSKEEKPARKPACNGESACK